MMRQIDIYGDQQADRVAEQFFRYSYHDRGMLKWQGYFLSDHTAALKRHRAVLKRRARGHYYPQQSPAQITARLKAAWRSHHLMLLVLNQVTTDGRYQILIGQISGYHGPRVVVCDRHQESHLVALSEIRHLSPVKLPLSPH